MPLWLLLFFATVLASVFLPAPAWLIAVTPILLGLSFLRPPRVDHEAVAMESPVRGRWAAINSPATKVPSHGVRSHAQTYAIDILHPRPPGSRPALGWSKGFRRPETFSSFGEPIVATADGVVVRTLSTVRDHRSRSSWPAIIYMMTVESGRDLLGARGVIGNHVVIEHADGVYSLAAHLRRGSVSVTPGDRVVSGQKVGEVGNSGNTSEPHLHWQLMDRPRSLQAAGIPFSWSDIEILVDEPDTSWTTEPVTTEVTPGVPATGQVFEA